MSAALARSPLTTSTLPGPAPAPPRAEERLGAPMREARRPLLLLALASLAVHVAVVSSVLVESRAAAPKPPRDIEVEVVQEQPKPPPSPAKAPAPPAAAKPVPPAPKPVVAKPVVAKPEAPKPEVAKAEPPKPLPPKPTPAKPEPAKPAPPKPELAKPPVEAAKTAPPKIAPPKTPQPAVDAARVAELEKELAALRAEREALEQASTKAPSGALRGFDAAALPSIAPGGEDGETASYEALVFSQLAKAKGIGKQKGRPGTAGVRFEVDDAGHLVNVDVVVPSGVPELDAEAIAVVKRAAPFLPPPKGAQHVFMANFNFVPDAQ